MNIVTRICAVPGCENVARRNVQNSACSLEHARRLSHIAQSEREKAERASHLPKVLKHKKFFSEPITCACGCGEIFTPSQPRNKFINETHWRNFEKVKRVLNKKREVCKCGCGETFVQTNNGRKEFINRKHAQKYQRSQPGYVEKQRLIEKEKSRKKYAKNKLERSLEQTAEAQKVADICELPVTDDSCNGMPSMEPKYNERGERVCVDCGIPITPVSVRCFQHANAARNIRGIGNCERCGKRILLRSTQKYCKDCTVVVRKEAQQRMRIASYVKPPKATDRLTLRIDAIVSASKLPGYNPAFPERFIEEA